MTEPQYDPDERDEAFAAHWYDRDDVEDHAFVAPDRDDFEKAVAVRLVDHEASEIRRGKRLLAKPHGSLSGPDGDPSPKEIRLMTAAIRSDWSTADLRRARCHQIDPVDIKTVRLGGG